MTLTCRQIIGRPRHGGEYDAVLRHHPADQQDVGRREKRSQVDLLKSVGELLRYDRSIASGREDGRPDGDARPASGEEPCASTGDVLDEHNGVASRSRPTDGSSGCHSGKRRQRNIRSEHLQREGCGSSVADAVRKDHSVRKSMAPSLIDPELTTPNTVKKTQL